MVPALESNMIGLTGPQARRIRKTADDIIAHPEWGAMHPGSVARIQRAMNQRCATGDALVRWALEGKVTVTPLVAALADLCVAAKCRRAAEALNVIAVGQAASHRGVTA